MMLRLAALAVLTHAASACAQLTPDRLYYGIGRSIPMTVRVPPDLKGEAVIQLLAPVSAEVKASASVVAGGVDLAGLFPSLWCPAVPPTSESLVYAQLTVGGRKIGSAVVLQPLVEPSYCVFIDPSGEPQFREPRATADGKPLPAPCSGLRAYIEKHVVLETSLGDIEFRLRPDQAPNTSYDFLQLAEGGLYTDVLFHRIVAINPSNHAPFVIQAGDPIRGHESGNPNPGDGGPGFLMNLERSRLPHDFGVLSMARRNDQRMPLPNSAGSQFFISLSREGTSVLDGQFCAFGQAVSGADVIQKIAAAPVGERDLPKEPPVIRRCRVIDAPPYGEGPGPVKAPPPRPTER
jgi:peptidyl-prolyl cis-trans isomerase B (cyclophilin B)